MRWRKAAIVGCAWGAVCQAHEARAAGAAYAVDTAEVFGQLGPRQDAIGVTEPHFQIGLRWRPVDEFNIDVIYGRNIAGENANWLTLATVFRFKAGP